MLGICVCVCVCVLPVIALRTSLAASSLASMEACSLYQEVWGVQIRLGASFRGPDEKLEREGRGGNCRRDLNVCVSACVCVCEHVCVCASMCVCVCVCLT